MGKENQALGPVAAAGLDIGQGIVETGLGMALGNYNDRRQLKQQRKLQNLQLEGMRASTDYQAMKEYEMWLKTGYTGQMEQLKKAGLNPGLLYGMGGAGGQSMGGSGGTPSGASAPQGAAISMEIGMQNAQRKLIEAQTENIQADTANKPLEGKKIEAGTLNLIAGTETEKVKKELGEIQVNIAQIEEDIKGATANAAKASIFTALREATERLQILTNEKEISDATQEEKIKMIRTELAGMYARNELTRAQTGKTKADTEQLAKQIALEYDKLANEKEKTKLQEKLTEFETSFGKQASAILQSLLGIGKMK